MTSLLINRRNVMVKKEFRKDFAWGVATAAPQIEGAGNIDGKGLSNWDIYPTLEGRVYQNQSNADGCDHYHHLKEDVALLAKLGVNSYRFSFAWTRIIPNGVGEINEKGLEFYDQLLDELEKYHIEPYATIFHWDFPYELVKQGGWLNKESVKWYFEYAKILIDRYKNRIKKWIPINEPACVMEMGGVKLEGRYTSKEKLQAIHNLLLAHGYAAKYIKENGGLVGTAVCSSLYAPYDEKNPLDIEAARKAMFITEGDNYWKTSMWLDPICFGKYPETYYSTNKKEDLPVINEDEMKIISTPIDFIGYNIYSGEIVKDDGKGGFTIVNQPEGNAKTCMDWEVFPRIMYWVPKLIYERYKKPFYITENGCAVTDILSEDKKVHDGPRIEYLKQYIKNLRLAYEDGVDVRGYMEWSFMDNYEWFHGYSKRFGLIYIDYKTKERILKDSFTFYQDTIKTNGGNL